MNLIELFESLTQPQTNNRNLFNAATIPQYPFAKVGINNEGFAAILITSLPGDTHLSQKNIRLKYLELIHNVECKISEAGKISYLNFTVIVFKSNESYLQHYFFGIVETLIKSLSVNSTQSEIIRVFKTFVEIFRSLSEIPTKTVQGLWAELFIIQNSTQPAPLLYYWHCKPEERFDFNADEEKLEVKSSSTLERVHFFASEQLNPPIGKNVLFASIFLKQVAHGQNISNLTKSIQQRIVENDLAEKMYGIVSKTLGNNLEQSIKLKFDYELAQRSLCFYRQQDIHKIEKICIPNEVSEVRYKSDLSELKSVMPTALFNKGSLFKAI